MEGDDTLQITNSNFSSSTRITESPLWFYDFSMGKLIIEDSEVSIINGNGKKDTVYGDVRVTDGTAKLVALGLKIMGSVCVWQRC